MRPLGWDELRERKLAARVPQMKHEPKFIQRVGYSNIYGVDSCIIWQSGFDIDADGSPHAYAPPRSGLVGLDYLVNAKNERGEFVGVAVDERGQPFIQGKNDPAPGFYVSTTSLQDNSLDKSDQRRYVNSETIPFAVIPNLHWFTVRKAALGTLGVAYYRHTKMHEFFVVADVGPMHKIGEGSIRLAHSLGINADAKTGGVSGGVVFMLFSGTSHDFAFPTRLVDDSTKFFQRWGDMPELIKLVEELFS